MAAAARKTTQIADFTVFAKQREMWRTSRSSQTVTALDFGGSSYQAIVAHSMEGTAVQIGRVFGASSS
jgi:hypothetical protein